MKISQTSWTTEIDGKNLSMRAKLDRPDEIILILLVSIVPTYHLDNISSELLLSTSEQSYVK